MTPELALRNLGLYSSQVAILTAAAAALAWAFRLRVPRAELVFWYMLLAMCVLFPFAQPWHASPAETAAQVTFGAIPLGTAVSRSGSFGLSWPYGWSGALLAVLAVGALLRLALLGLGVIRLRRLEHRAAPAPRCVALDCATTLAGAEAEFRWSDEVLGPVTFGLRRPVVLLPAGFYDLAPAEQESVAVHELLHVRRSDWLYTIGEEIVRAVLWFHPAIWFVLNRIQLAREQAVDRAVVDCTRYTDEYVGALLKIAAARIEPDLAPAPLFLKKRHLRERVAAIVKGANMSKRRLSLTMFAVLAALPLMAAFLAWQIPLRAAPQGGPRRRRCGGANGFLQGPSSHRRGIPRRSPDERDLGWGRGRGDRER
jgi:beta-lactamase regulating signal transducer with metallopeptidase domain